MLSNIPKKIKKLVLVLITSMLVTIAREKTERFNKNLNNKNTI